MKESGFLEGSSWRGCLRILLLCPLLVSCTTLSITYSTADWILLWKLDGYFNLSQSQEKYLKNQIQALHVWHQHQQLPRYTEFLSYVDQLAKNELSPADLESIFASVERFRGHLAHRIAPLGAGFLASVTPLQILHLEKVLDQDYQQLVSEVGTDSEVRLAKRVATILDTLTSWVGELTVDQETFIRERVKTIPDITDQWLAHRKHRQAWLLELLRSSDDPMLLEKGLSQWLADSKTGATDDYLVAFTEWREEMKRAVLDIDRMITPDQRVHFSGKVEELIQEIQGLVG